MITSFVYIDIFEGINIYIYIYIISYYYYIIMYERVLFTPVTCPLVFNK